MPEKGKTILFVVQGFPLEIQNFVTSHITGMTERGWQVVVAARDLYPAALAGYRARVNLAAVHNLGEESKVFSEAKKFARKRAVWSRFGLFHRFRFPSGGKTEARALALLNVAKRWKPDVMHAHFGESGLMAIPVALRLRVPLAVSYHGDDLLSNRVLEQNPYLGAMDRSIAVVYSDFMEGIARQRLRCPIERIRFGVPENTFNPAAAAPAWPAGIRLIVIGRLIGYKGMHVAIRAVAELTARETTPTFSLTLVGDGPARAELASLAADLKVPVEFTGLIPHHEVAKRLAQSDIALVPSLVAEHGWQETFCLVALEAMSCGKPVIAADTGALPETVGAGGRIVRRDDPSALADAISALLAETTPDQCARDALARARQFSHMRMLDEYDALARRMAESS